MLLGAFGFVNTELLGDPFHMANPAFSFETFHSNGDQATHLLAFGTGGEATKAEQEHFFGTETWVGADYLYPDYNFNQVSSFENESLFPEDLGIPHEMYSNPIYATTQPHQEHMMPMMAPDCNLVNSCVTSIMELDEPKEIMKYTEPRKENVYPLSAETLDLLKSYRTGRKKLNGEKLINSRNEGKPPTVGGRQLSTEEVMRVAAARYIQFSVHEEDDLSMITHRSGSMLSSSLIDEEIRDVELAHLLLASAEKISNQQYVRASKLLMQCCYLSSKVGNPVERVVHYFAKALQARIRRETEGMSSKKSTEKVRWEEEVDEKINDPHPAILEWYKRLPFPQILQCTEMQVIIDNVGSAKRIHLIDLGLGIGIQWTILMQALTARSACPVELLKITAVGTSDKIIKTKKWLVSFAETLNLPFSFNAVVVSEMEDIKEDLFEVEADEVVAVYAPMVLRTMIVRPDCLEKLMKVIKNLKPCIMTVTEIDANHNSPSFINRFTEVLFYFSVWFDCFDTYMDRNNQNRELGEEIFYEGIRRIVATEGSERLIRHVRIDTWRSFFTHCRFVEAELSQLSLDQAHLVVKQYGSCCTLDMNGKCLIVGWKGNPLLSFSAWKLQ